MPILTESTSPVLGGRAVRLPGLPDFNAGDPAWKINSFEGWFDGLAPTAELVANGGGPGASAVGDWDPAEAYYTISGRVDVSSADRATIRRALLAALPLDREVSVAVLGGGVDVDQQIFVRRYDKPAFPPGESVLRFVLPLVAPDPYKYGLEELVATAGAFESEDWFFTYSEDAGDWYQTYDDDGASEFWQPYETDESATSDQNRVTSIDSPGSETSRRVTTTVTGPLMAGDWFIDNVETGERVWVELTLAAGESVVLDTANWSTTLQGSPVDHLQFGEFPTLRPGANSWRLITNGASGAGHMTIRALPAYE